MSIKFQHSGMSELTLERGRVTPYVPEEIEPHQDLYLTEGNNPKVINYGDPLKFMKLEFKYLSRDNYDGTVNGLKTWFEDSTINWSANNFTLVDENNVSWTVRLWQKKFNMKNLGNDRYSVELVLLIES